ncbi:hypothetical protein [Streptomyces sp. NPDC050504]|uniref:hypothetical protein n=1 Tax=Streptomyces sp. NPDC050504 TaxID=3365618 RepID=UPI0037A94E47
MRITRRAVRLGTLLAAVTAAGVLATAPASAAGVSWTSCSGSQCDAAAVNNDPPGRPGSQTSVLDGSNDGRGAALHVQLVGQTGDGWVYGTLGGPSTSRSAYFDVNVKRARICDWDGVVAYNCGGWKNF